MRTIIIMSSIIVLAGCGDSNTNHTIETSASSSNDTTQIINNKENRFVQYEKDALDSVSFYKLDSVYHECLKYLYVLYGNYQLPGREITIGECNIRLTGFSADSVNTRKMYFNVFINDTIPAGVYLVLKDGGMINGFSVDIKSRELHTAIAGAATMEMKDVRRLYKNAIRSDILKKYIDAHKTKLHPKYVELLPR